MNAEQDIPIEVEGSAPKVVLATLFRQISLIIAGATVIAGLVAKRDLIGIVTWLQTTEGLTFAATVWLLVTLAWGQLRTLRWQAKAVRMQAVLPDTIAKLK